jgi:hypothetical protein
VKKHYTKIGGTSFGMIVAGIAIMAGGHGGVGQPPIEHWVQNGESSSQAVSGSLRFDATKNLRFTVSNDFGPRA